MRLRRHMGSLASEFYLEWIATKASRYRRVRTVTSVVCAPYAPMGSVATLLSAVSDPDTEGGSCPDYDGLHLSTLPMFVARAPLNLVVCFPN